MAGKDIKVSANGGGEFDCYLAIPGGQAKVPAIVLASAIHGVDADIRAIADELASLGFIAYSWLVGNWVFIVSNTLILLTALAGELGLLLRRRRSADAASGKKGP